MKKGRSLCETNMSERRNAAFTIGIISGVILFLSIMDIFKTDSFFSETENRILKGKPKFSISSLFQGVYTKEYEEYATDQFVGRDKWISIKTWTDLALQKKTINGVYLGKDKYLFEQHKQEDFSQELIDKRLELLDEFVEKWDAQVMLVPTADQILKEKMVTFAPSFDQKSFLKQVEERIGAHHMIDVFGELYEHREEEIYYRTDHHWTSLGAYYGYRQWAFETQNYYMPYLIPNREIVSSQFLGTLHSKINIPYKKDVIHIFPETISEKISIQYDFQENASSFYEEEYLQTKNQYGYFLDDNHGFVEIHTQASPGKTLFLVKDSYANCFVPFLPPYYDTIYIIDLRYVNTPLFPFMEKLLFSEGNNTDVDVLLLYNCIHFLKEFQYY